jgi:hypothetical protein
LRQISGREKETIPVKNKIAATSGSPAEVGSTNLNHVNPKSAATESPSGHVGRRDFLSQTATMTAGAIAGIWSLTGPERASANRHWLRSAKLYGATRPSAANDRVHYFHADASALGGYLTRPAQQIIPVQAPLSLPAAGGYASARAENFHLEGVASCKSAFTEVLGRLSEEEGRGWITTVTSVVEGLNLFDVITADRLVAKISTEHPLVGNIPSVTFQGTSFENLKIAGHSVDLTLDLDICDRGKGRGYPSQPTINDERFLARVGEQYERMNDANNLPAWVEDRTVPDWIKGRYNSEIVRAGKEGSVVASVVKETDGEFQGRPFANVFEVPGLGKVFLGELLVNTQSYRLSTLRVELRGRVHGHFGGSIAESNGHTYPPIQNCC